MASVSWRPSSWSTKAMRSYCTGETRVEVAKRSRRQPAPEELSPGTSPPSLGQKHLPTRSTSSAASTLYPQCGHWFSRETGGDGTRSSKPLRCQCARALHSDGADRKTEAIGLCELRHASRRASEDGRSALDKAILERRVGLRGEQAVRCFVGICRRSPLERRQIQRAGAWMGSDKDGRPFSTGRSSSGVYNSGVACHE